MKNENKIYCANCLHCKLFREPFSDKAIHLGLYYLRTRCDKGRWITKTGKNYIYKLYTADKRVMDECVDYEPMGNDMLDYIEWLGSVLPEQDFVYQDRRYQVDKAG